MFCQKCGNQLAEDAKFCNKCGNATGEAKKEVKKVDDNTVVYNVKSKFKLLYHSISMIIVFVIILLFTALPLFTSGELGTGGFFVMSTIMAGFLAFMLIVWAISMLFTRAQYKKYNYDFYNTKVIYSDSFFNISEKEVKYKFVREIVYTQTFIQRFFNIGTITLYTNAESGFGNGIIIRSVENVKDVYQKIKEVVNV